MQPTQLNLYSRTSALVFVMVFAGLLSFDVMAASDMWDKLNEKGSAVYDGLKVIIPIITTVAVCVVGLLMYKGRMGNQIGFAVILGSIVIGAAAEIATFLVS